MQRRPYHAGARGLPTLGGASKLVAMALIRCPDCGRKVSDLAVACPDCARPIAASPVGVERAASGLTGGGAGASGPRGDATPMRPPRALRAAPPAPAPAPAPLPPPIPIPTLAAQSAYTATKCMRCGEDFVLAYRVKDRAAFVCDDCGEREHLHRHERRQLLRGVGIGVAVLLLIAAAVAVPWWRSVYEPHPVAPHVPIE